MGIWTNAFKMPAHPDVNEEEKSFLSALALKVNKRSMGTAVALAVESTRPLHNLGSQALVFLAPMLNSIFDKEDTERLIRLLENPKAVTFFVDQLNEAGTSDLTGNSPTDHATVKQENRDVK